MGVLPAFLSVYHIFVVPIETRRGRWIPWDWSSRQCWEVNLEASKGAASALNC